MSDRLIAISSVRRGDALMITQRGRSALSRAALQAANARPGVVAWSAAWDHPVNASQRWMVACHVGMRLLGWEYDPEADDRACLMAAWDAMGPPAGRYLLRASLPLLLVLWDIAECGPVPLASAVEDVCWWAAECGHAASAVQARYVAPQFRRAAGVGLVQIGADPWPPAGQDFRELVGPAAGWVLYPPDTGPRPVLRVVEG